MRKLFFSLALCVAFFTACSDDDDEPTGKNGKAVNSSASIISTDNGKYVLSQISNMNAKFYYDSDGQCILVKDGSYDFLVVSDPAKIVGEIDDYEYEIALSFNDLGYISKVEASWICPSCTSNGDVHQGTYTINASYTAKQLSSMDFKSETAWTDYDYNEEETYTEEGSIEFTFKDGCRSSADMKCEWWEEDVYSNNTSSYSGSNNYSIIYSHSSRNNEYQQYPYSYYRYLNWCCDDLSDIRCLFFIGWFGKGPEQYVSSITCVNGDETSSVSTTFSINSDNTINCETIGSSNYYYYYKVLTNKSLEDDSFDEEVAPKEHKSCRDRIIEEREKRLEKIKD